MKLINQGKTKDVYVLADSNYLLKFKDDMTGEDGKFDPGANTVGLTVAGAGQAGLRLSVHFFELLARHGIPTHFVSADIDAATMTVTPAKTFGKGLEVICRYRAVGSFLRRYGLYASPGQPLDAYVEVTLKDDERQDPTISDDALAMLGILSLAEYQKLKQLTQQISGLIRTELATKDVELYDIKLEFGRASTTNEIILIDEISGGNMRAYQDDKMIEPLDLTNIVLP